MLAAYETKKSQSHPEYCFKERLEDVHLSLLHHFVGMTIRCCPASLQATARLHYCQSAQKPKSKKEKQAVIKCSMFASIYHFSERSPVSLRWSYFSNTFNYAGYCWCHSQILFSNYNLMSGAEDVRARIIFTWPSKFSTSNIVLFELKQKSSIYWAKAEAVVYCLLLWCSWQQETDGHKWIWEENVDGGTVRRQEPKCRGSSFALSKHKWLPSYIGSEYPTCHRISNKVKSRLLGPGPNLNMDLHKKTKAFVQGKKKIVLMDCQGWGHFLEEEGFWAEGSLLLHLWEKKLLLKKIGVRGFSFYMRLTFWLHKVKKSSIWQWLNRKEMKLAASKRLREKSSGGMKEGSKSHKIILQNCCWVCSV